MACGHGRDGFSGIFSERIRIFGLLERSVGMSFAKGAPCFGGVFPTPVAATRRTKENNQPTKES
jgi:hypothetical protein